MGDTPVAAFRPFNDDVAPTMQPCHASLCGEIFARPVAAQGDRRTERRMGAAASGACLSVTRSEHAKSNKKRRPIPGPEHSQLLARSACWSCIDFGPAAGGRVQSGEYSALGESQREGAHWVFTVVTGISGTTSKAELACKQMLQLPRDTAKLLCNAL